VTADVTAPDFATTPSATVATVTVDETSPV